MEERITPVTHRFLWVGGSPVGGGSGPTDWGNFANWSDADTGLGTGALIPGPTDYVRLDGNANFNCVANANEDIGNIDILDFHKTLEITAGHTLSIHNINATETDFNGRINESEWLAGSDAAIQVDSGANARQGGHLVLDGGTTRWEGGIPITTDFPNHYKGDLLLWHGGILKLDSDPKSLSAHLWIGYEPSYSPDIESGPPAGTVWLDMGSNNLTLANSADIYVAPFGQLLLYNVNPAGAGIVASTDSIIDNSGTIIRSSSRGYDSGFRLGANVINDGPNALFWIDSTQTVTVTGNGTGTYDFVQNQGEVKLYSGSTLDVGTGVHQGYYQTAGFVYCVVSDRTIGIVTHFDGNSVMNGGVINFGNIGGANPLYAQLESNGAITIEGSTQVDFHLDGSNNGDCNLINASNLELGGTNGSPIVNVTADGFPPAGWVYAVFQGSVNLFNGILPTLHSNVVCEWTSNPPAYVGILIDAVGGGGGGG